MNVTGDNIYIHFVCFRNHKYLKFCLLLAASVYVIYSLPTRRNQPQTECDHCCIILHCTDILEGRSAYAILTLNFLVYCIQIFSVSIALL